MHKRINDFLNKKELIYHRQFGFRPKYSTEYALLDLVEDIKKYIDYGNYVCGIFVDLKKAFDTVDHEILLGKLPYYGILGISLNWFRTILLCRKQYVKIKDINSNTKEIKCGVPQGSTLGPLLFLLYINDMHLIFEKLITRHFADDTCLMFHNKKIKSIKTGSNKKKI